MDSEASGRLPGQDLKKIEDPRAYYFDLLRRRREILNFILEMWKSQDFAAYDVSFSEDLHIGSYNEFVQVQRDQVNLLSEQGILDTEGLIRLIDGDKLQIYARDERGPIVLWNLLFDQYGILNFRID